MKIIINSEIALQSAVGQLLSYCPETGLLHWKVSRGRCSAGAEAGYDSGRGYIGVRVMGRCMYAHRVAFLLMSGTNPEFVDHINGIRSDNRWKNLREVSRSQNGMNMAMPVTNTSGCMGVFWNEGKRMWTARIKKNQVTRHLGHFASFDDAVKARKQAELAEGFHANHGRPTNGRHESK